MRESSGLNQSCEFKLLGANLSLPAFRLIARTTLFAGSTSS